MRQSDDRIRVLWLVKGLGPGGAERLLLSSAGVADHSRFAYQVAFLRADKTHLVDAFSARGVTPRRLGAASGTRYGWLRELRALLGGVDVAHSHSPVLAGAARVAALTLSPSQRPAMVSTEHSEWTSHRLPTRLLNGLTAPVDTQRWAVSEQVRQTVWGPLRKDCDLLIHGIDRASTVPSEERGAIRRDLGVPSDAVLAVTVANFRRVKDYPNLLEATRIALEAAPDLRFLAVGQGPLEAETRDLHRALGLGERFGILGYRDDVPRILAAADLFVLASAHEGLPVAMMEALAAGRPVVATAVGGIPEAVTSGVHGLLVPPNDASALAGALVTLARDGELRSRMSAAARARSADFDIARTVREEERVYAEVGRAVRRRAGRRRATLPAHPEQLR